MSRQRLGIVSDENSQSSLAEIDLVTSNSDGNRRFTVFLQFDGHDYLADGITSASLTIDRASCGHYVIMLSASRW